MNALSGWAFLSSLGSAVMCCIEGIACSLRLRPRRHVCESSPTVLKSSECPELATNGEVLHDLRKQAKRLRYQMELFTDLYGESYANCIAEVKNIQEILGAMQDSAVLAQWLADVFNSEIDSQLPTLASMFAQNRYKLWQQWQPLQQQYLKAETRQRFHFTILQPV